MNECMKGWVFVSYVDMILHYNIITMHMLPQDGDARVELQYCIVGLCFCEVGDTIKWHVGACQLSFWQYQCEQIIRTSNIYLDNMNCRHLSSLMHN